jgi:hypothetical protein
MPNREIETLDLLEKYVESGVLNLDEISNLDYDTIELLCDQLLHWKLFVSNHHHHSGVVDRWLQNGEI